MVILNNIIEGISHSRNVVDRSYNAISIVKALSYSSAVSRQYR